MKKKIVTIILLVQFFFAGVCHADRWFQLATIVISTPTVDADFIDDASKFDIVIINDEAYDDYTCSGDCTSDRYDNAATTWRALDFHNENIKIFTYTTVWASQDEMSGCTDSDWLNANSVGHYSVGCDQSGGPLTDNDNEVDDDDYLMRDDSICEPESCTAANTPADCCTGAYPGDQNTGCSNANGAVDAPETPDDWQYLKFGKSAVSDWVNEILAEKIMDKAWAGDGIFSDGNRCDISPSLVIPSGTLEADYDTDAEWSTLGAASLSSHQGYLQSNYSADIIGNAGPFNNDSSADHPCYDAWVKHNNSANPPWLLSEHTFIHRTGADAIDIWLLSGDPWEYAVDSFVLTSIHAIVGGSTTRIGRDSTNCSGACTDQDGDAVTYGELLFYHMTSYAIAMHSNTYFAFYREYGQTTSYSAPIWSPLYDEMDDGDNLHLGAAISSYSSDTLGGQTIYYREFEKGYVYVNPQSSDATSFNLPEPCKILTYDNYSDELSGIASSSSMSLGAQRGVFLYKESAIGTLHGIQSSGVNFQ